MKENKEKNKSNELDEAYNDHIIEEEVQEVEPYTNVGKSKTSTTTQKWGKRKASAEGSSYFAPRTTPSS